MEDRGNYRPSIEETFPGLLSASAQHEVPPVNFRRFSALVRSQEIGMVILNCGEEQFDYTVDAGSNRNAMVFSQPRLGSSGGKVFPVDRIIFY